MSATLSPEMLQWLAQLQGLQGVPGMVAPAGMSDAVLASGIPQQAGPPLPADMVPQTADQGQRFPMNAALLAGLGAAGMGLRAGQRPPAIAAGTPSVPARAPGGFNPTYNRLPGGR